MLLLPDMKELSWAGNRKYTVFRGQRSMYCSHSLTSMYDTQENISKFSYKMTQLWFEIS